jgi:hypothetical protein
MVELEYVAFFFSPPRPPVTANSQTFRPVRRSETWIVPIDKFHVFAQKTPLRIFRLLLQPISGPIRNEGVTQRSCRNSSHSAGAEDEADWPGVDRATPVQENHFYPLALTQIDTQMYLYVFFVSKNATDRNGSHLTLHHYTLPLY